jgi:hypothetical protein
VPAVNVASLGSEGGNLHLLIVEQDNNHAEFGTHLQGAPEQPHYVFRLGIGGNVEVLGSSA